MAHSVYTSARLRKIPFFTFNPFLRAQSRDWIVNCDVIPSPSSHDALWKQVGVAANATEWAMGVLEGVG